MNLNRVRGVRDLLEHDTEKIQKILKTFHKFTQKAGFNHITLPTLEDSALYTKSLGDSSDIVSKEMFYIQDKAYVLRPEGTAGAIRCYLMNCIQGEKKQWSYSGSMFRHEQPQKLRFREFLQFGIESISNSFSAASDAEVIILASDILSHLQVPAVLEINTLGDEHARKAYNVALGKYFHSKSLSKHSETRKKNEKFLRILDSKEEADQEAILNAPSIVDFLNQKEKCYFEEIKSILEQFKVPFVHNPRLVRGLDYYSNVCFEFVNEKAIVGGGRYDNLAGMVEKEKNLGGIGWAAGIDRICELFKMQPTRNTVGVVPVGAEGIEMCMKIARKLRLDSDFTVKMRTEAQNIKQHMSYLKHSEPLFIVFIGEDELKSQTVKIKICDLAEHVFVPIKDMMDDPGTVLKSYLPKTN